MRYNKRWRGRVSHDGSGPFFEMFFCGVSKRAASHWSCINVQRPALHPSTIEIHEMVSIGGRMRGADRGFGGLSLRPGWRSGRFDIYLQFPLDPDNENRPETRTFIHQPPKSPPIDVREFVYRPETPKARDHCRTYRPLSASILLKAGVLCWGKGIDGCECRNGEINTKHSNPMCRCVKKLSTRHIEEQTQPRTTRPFEPDRSRRNLENLAELNRTELRERYYWLSAMAR